MLTLEGGKSFEPNDNTEVCCEVHNVKTTWGKMSGIARLALEEGLDTDKDLECLLLARDKDN